MNADRAVLPEGVVVVCWNCDFAMKIPDDPKVIEFFLENGCPRCGAGPETGGGALLLG